MKTLTATYSVTGTRENYKSNRLDVMNNLIEQGRQLGYIVRENWISIEDDYKNKTLTVNFLENQQESYIAFKDQYENSN